ncbi:hypothetical protein [Nostoc sp. MS1]|uniref:hypothetical protein n=1 Tax=Nostoc sp. MS1 TaxID=2764711 RepID=UPI001CC5D8C4|nr:hypothetical protein [Nostoc sp. MS1]BCL34487.1 hypothetical protein NSMS1_09340 [Nostoc sp. MS1]
MLEIDEYDYQLFRKRDIHNHHQNEKIEDTVDYTKFQMPVINQKTFVSNCLLVLTLLTSCNNSSSKEDLKKEIQSVTSWAATTGMVGNAWLQGNIPSKYAQQTLDKAQTEFIQEKNKISQIQAQTTIIKSCQSLIINNVAQLANQTAKISQAIKQNNHLLAQQELTELDSELQKLHQLRTKLEASYEKIS